MKKIEKEEYLDKKENINSKYFQKKDNTNMEMSFDEIFLHRIYILTTYVKSTTFSTETKNIIKITSNVYVIIQMNKQQ